MNRIDEKFQELRARKKKALVAYLTLGFPDLETNLAQILEMDRRGVSIIEIGIPFTDPTADGPTIQVSSQKALEAGISLEDAFRLARRVRESSGIPLLLMGYLNPFLALPPERLAGKLRSAGIDGLIVPDLPPEEAGRLGRALSEKHIHLVFLVAPTSPPERVRFVARASRGFVYCVSRAGVTGEKGTAARNLEQLVGEIKAATKTPVCVGFGISTRTQVEKVEKIADGAIVGSALIKPFLEESSPRTGLKRTLVRVNELLGNDSQ